MASGCGTFKNWTKIQVSLDRHLFPVSHLCLDEISYALVVELSLSGNKSTVYCKVALSLAISWITAWLPHKPREFSPSHTLCLGPVSPSVSSQLTKKLFRHIGNIGSNQCGCVSQYEPEAHTQTNIIITRFRKQTPDFLFTLFVRQPRQLLVTSWLLPGCFYRVFMQVNNVCTPTSRIWYCPGHVAPVLGRFSPPGGDGSVVERSFARTAGPTLSRCGKL